MYTNRCSYSISSSHRLAATLIGLRNWVQFLHVSAVLGHLCNSYIKRIIRKSTLCKSGSTPYHTYCFVESTSNILFTSNFSTDIYQGYSTYHHLQHSSLFCHDLEHNTQNDKLNDLNNIYLKLFRHIWSYTMEEYHQPVQCSTELGLGVH